MAIQKILIWPSDTLKKKSEPVKPEQIGSEEIKALVRDLLDTCVAAEGVGLSAIQIGVPLRVLVVQGVAVVNPEIIETLGRAEKMPEGCLSFPGVFEQVPRYNQVKVKGFDAAGNATDGMVVGLTAQCFQHEIEHLDGMLLSDRMSKIRARQVREYLTKLKKTMK